MTPKVLKKVREESVLRICLDESDKSCSCYLLMWREE